MASPDHIKWLLEGVDAWNKRRERDNFIPDFEDANIPSIFGKQPGGGRRFGSGHPMWHSTAWDAIITPLRGINLIGANLIGADLQRVDLSKSDLRGAKLKRAKLRGATLTGANLTFAKFEGEADLSHAVLKDTFLLGLDLSGVNFECADLRNANLGGAELAQSRFVGADLIGANFMGKHPWKADLFPGPADVRTQEITNNVRPKGIRPQPIAQIEDLLEICRSLAGQHTEEVLFFRGESKNDWELAPAVMRHDTTIGHHDDVEGKLLLALMSRRPEEFSFLTSALSQWVLAQHHGLRTRLLDITRNPLVALFHACEKEDHNGRIHVFAVSRDLIKAYNSPTVSIIANFAKLSRREQKLILGDIESLQPTIQSADEYMWAMHRLYQYIRLENPSFEERIDPRDFFRVCVVEPQQSFERIRAQSGAFLISAFHKRFERDIILAQNAKIPVYHHYPLTVRRAKKAPIMEGLRLLNVTRESLYPGLDETAKAITQQYWPGRSL